jgi:transposase
MDRGDLTDAQWTRLQPLLPPPRPAKGSKGGRPRNDDRPVINGILWILRTGAPWEDLPARYGKRSTVSTRYYRWIDQGIWDRIYTAVQAQADADGALDWELHHVDATVIRAHQHAAGAKQGNPQTEALGRSQGGFSTKVHLRAEGNGKPMTIVLTPGEQHESTVFEQLMEQGAVKRPRRGRPRLRPKRVVGDKGYSSRKIRAYLRRRGIGYTIPRKTNERRTGPFNRAIYRLRNRVERLINRLKQFRRLATRYEKRAENYHGMWVLAAILLWL